MVRMRERGEGERKEGGREGEGEKRERVREKRGRKGGRKRKEGVSEREKRES